MPKKPKPNSVENTEIGKSSVKKKGTKRKSNDLTQDKADNEELSNVAINDETWHCSVVLLVPQTNGLCIFLTHQLSNLPENFTVINKDAITNNKDRNGPNKASQKASKTRKSSVRSSSKNSKQSSKSKSTKSKRKSKEKAEEKENIGESSNSEENSLKVGLAIKKCIFSLKNDDIRKVNGKVANNEIDLIKTMRKNRQITINGSGDRVNTKTAEADRDVEYVFHRFVILLGFYDPLMPEILTKINISVKAVISVRNLYFEESYSNKRSSIITRNSKRKSSVKSKKHSVDGRENIEYTHFVEKMSEFLSYKEYLEKCKDTIFLNYKLEHILPRSSKIEMEHKSELLDLFNKIKIAWEKYVCYKENLFVQNIPLSKEILKLDNAKIYNTMVSMVPLECTSTSVVLHCILEQIVWWNNEHFSEENKQSQPDYINSINKNSPSNPKTLGKNKTPILIHHRDEINYNTFHLDLPEFDFEQISSNMFIKSPVCKLWERYPPHSKSVKKWYEFQMQKLQNSSEDCIFKMDRLFSIYLHHSLMAVLIFKTQPCSKIVCEEGLAGEELVPTNKLLLSGNCSGTLDKNSNLFARDIICNIICKVPHFSLCQSYLPTDFFDTTSFSADVAQEPVDKRDAATDRLSKVASGFPVGSLLQKRELNKKEKLNKIASFLNCTEFLNLFECFSKLNHLEFDKLVKYKFVEKLSKENLFQCLQSAFQDFSYVNYDYFPVSDSILLWFNNSERQTFSCSTSKGLLHTELGFRDFYLYKLKENTDIVGNVKKENEVDVVTDDPESVAKLKSTVKESFTDSGSKTQDDMEVLSIVDVTKLMPKVVYDLGSLWMESSEACSNFFSDDSSFVTVKRAKYFDDNRYITVNINKNNTSLKYDLNPDSSSNFVELFIDVNNTLNVSCVFKWGKSCVPRNTFKFSDKSDYFVNRGEEIKLKCSLNIKFPSGLFVEVVPTNSIFGPFYVRQSYLEKGPNCSAIWEEAYRCYFNNGMILIFRVDHTVDILYSNGTIVKCHSLEKIQMENLFDTKNSEIHKTFAENPSKRADLEQDFSTIKGGAKSQQNKKGKVKAQPSKSDNNEKDTLKMDKKSKGKLNRDSKIAAETEEELICTEKETTNKNLIYKITEHSVLSWDGVYLQYQNDHCKDVKKDFELKMAFSIINHELYWQRNDGMSSLQAPCKHSVKFPDGSRTTSYTIDDKEIWVENGHFIIYRNTGELVKVELLPLDPSEEPVEADNDFDAKKGSNVSDIFFSSTNSFDTESVEEKCFAYVENNVFMEHPSYASIEYSNEECKLKLDLPGNCWVIIDENGLFTFKGNRNERITLFNNSLIFEANVLSSPTLAKSTTNLRFENVNDIPEIFSQTEDSFGNLFSVDERGNVTYSSSSSGANNDQPKSDSLSACYPQSVERFFVFNRDLTGYEMIHEVEQSNLVAGTQDASTVTTPIVEGSSELYNFYLQSAIHRSKSEEYLMHCAEDLLPSLIKRKDLLKPNKTPESIWFYPELSSVTKDAEKKEIDTVQGVKQFKAMSIVQRLKVMEKSSNVVSMFSKCLRKYVHDNERIYQKYLSFYLTETHTEEDLKECKKNKVEFLGSKSYYLTDNLPRVLTGILAQGKETNQEILNIFSPSASKISL